MKVIPRTDFTGWTKIDKYTLFPINEVVEVLVHCAGEYSREFFTYKLDKNWYDSKDKKVKYQKNIHYYRKLTI